MYSYRNAIGQLENDRNALQRLLQQEREESGQELERVKQHMEMQLQQQLKQQLRHVQEHFHQQIHDQQLKVQTMQQTIDEYKKREDLIQADVNDNGINYETLKVAFHQLQVVMLQNIFIIIKRFSHSIVALFLFDLCTSITTATVSMNITILSGGVLR